MGCVGVVCFEEILVGCVGVVCFGEVLVARVSLVLVGEVFLVEAFLVIGLAGIENLFVMDVSVGVDETGDDEFEQEASDELELDRLTRRGVFGFCNGALSIKFCVGLSSN